MRKIFLLLLFILPATIYAQQECAYILEEAQDMFDAGLIETIPEKLSDCLNRGFTKEEKLQAYKLIILSYVFDDDYERADAMMLEFLRDFPAYEPVATDPMEFIAIMETYDTRPKLMYGVRLGTSLTFPSVIENLGTWNNEIHQGRYVPGRVGFQGAFKLEKMLGYHLHLSGEVSFANMHFDYYLDDERENPMSAAEITDFSIIEYYETQNYLRLPLSFSYTPTNGDFRPYFSAGVIPSIMLSAIGEGARRYTGTLPYREMNVANVNMMDIRRSFNMWAFIGLGFRVGAGPGDFFMDARLSYNLLNQIPNGVNLYLDDLAPLLYVNDHFRLNNVVISAGYLFPLYHPKKKAE